MLADLCGRSKASADLHGTVDAGRYAAKHAGKEDENGKALPELSEYGVSAR